MNPTGIINNFQDFLDVICARSGHWQVETWWRGEPAQKAEWMLVPKVFRDTRNALYEHNVTERFRRSAPTRHRNCPGYADLPAWLFFMQHYGLPTRLLDWTESPLTALFFAVSEANYKFLPATLWCLSPTSLNEHLIQMSSILLPYAEPVLALSKQAFDGARTEPNRVLALYPSEFDLRMTLQLSAFTLHGDPTALDRVPGADEFLRRYTIPPQAKFELGGLLHTLGIRRSLLFPDPQNLAQCLAEGSYADAPPAMSPPPSKPAH